MSIGLLFVSFSVPLPIYDSDPPEESIILIFFPNIFIGKLFSVKKKAKKKTR